MMRGVVVFKSVDEISRNKKDIRSFREDELVKRVPDCKLLQECTIVTHTAALSGDVIFYHDSI